MTIYVAPYILLLLRQHQRVHIYTTCTCLEEIVIDGTISEICMCNCVLEIIYGHMNTLHGIIVLNSENSSALYATPSALQTLPQDYYSHLNPSHCSAHSTFTTGIIIYFFAVKKQSYDINMPYQDTLL